jgi:ubiquinone/menaquinone biosynthesis C-methylase UbiE
MGISTAMQQQGAKPHGFFGRMIGIMMNRGHRDVYQWGLDKLGSVRSKTILDLGCGGGAVLNMLSKSAGKVCGVDHSEEMVSFARKKNRKADNAEIKCASVLDIPYPEGDFNAVTAFETVQHWPDIKKAFCEAHRVLASSGLFLIVNRYPKADSKWINYLKLKNAEAYKDALEEAGFTQVTADMSRSGWICVTAVR